MSCEWTKSVLSLFLYGELTFEEEESVHRHLNECEACRKSLERERALHAALNQAELEPPTDMVADCRVRLRKSLRGQPARRGFLARLWDWTGQPVPIGLLKPAGALALVAVGFFSARVTQPKPEAVIVPADRAPVATQVRYLQPDPSGKVSIYLDETRERVLSGDLGEAPIRRLVLEAAQDAADPGLRLDSLDILQTHGDYPQVRKAFLQALQSDSNAGVRIKAIEGLKPYGADPQVRSVLAGVLLSDENIGVRTQAIDLLLQHRNSAQVGVLQQLLEKEQDGYIRERVQRALGEMNASMGAF